MPISGSARWQRISRPGELRRTEQFARNKSQVLVISVSFARRCLVNERNTMSIQPQIRAFAGTFILVSLLQSANIQSATIMDGFVRRR
jgi:hypothetical protein